VDSRGWSRSRVISGSTSRHPDDPTRPQTHRSDAVGDRSFGSLMSALVPTTTSHPPPSPPSSVVSIEDGGYSSVSQPRGQHRWGATLTAPSGDDDDVRRGFDRKAGYSGARQAQATLYDHRYGGQYRPSLALLWLA
jgi:hypothetical protein